MAANTGSAGSYGTVEFSMNRQSSIEDEAAGYSYATDICLNKSASVTSNRGSFSSDTNYALTQCNTGNDDASVFYYDIGTAGSGGITSVAGGMAIQTNSMRARSVSSEDVSLLSYTGGSVASASAAGGGGTASSKNNSAGARCSVCGDEASGFHYGVDSCEGCKGFFRRCIIQGLTQQCANSEKCEITPLTRNSCQFCRLKKCFAVGMSRGASRLGRRPKRLKAHYSTETKIQVPAKPISIAPQPGPLFASKLPLSMAELETLLEKLNSQNRYNIKLPSLLAALNSLLDDGGRVSTPATDERVDGGSISLSPGIRSSDTDIKQLSISSRQLSPDTTGSETGLLGTAHLTEANATAYHVKTEPGMGNKSSGSLFHNGITRDPKAGSNIANTSDARALVGTVYHQLREAEQRRKMLGEPKPAASSQLVSVADVVVVPPSVPDIVVPGTGDDEALRQAIAELVDEARRLPVPGSERATLVEQVIRSVIDAHMNTCNYTKEKIEVGLAKYIELHQGQPTDNLLDDIDPMKIWSAFVANMAPVIQRVVTFSKSLPGFSELCQDDQIKLIKQGSFEVILARYVPLFTDKGMFVPDMTFRVPFERIQLMPLGDFFCEQYKFANIVNQLELCDGEIGLLTAIMIINPDRMGVTNRRAIYKLRGLLLQSLYVYMKSIRPDTFDEKFLSTVNTLVLSDRINKMHSCALNNMKLTSPELKLPELHMEVYDGLP